MMFWLMWVAMIAFWILLAWAINSLVTGVTRRPAGSGRGGQQPGEAHPCLVRLPIRGVAVGVLSEHIGHCVVTAARSTPDGGTRLSKIAAIIGRVVRL